MNIADRERQWILQFQMITGARGIVLIFHSGQLGENSRQRTGMDTDSHAEPLLPWNAWVHQSIILLFTKNENIKNFQLE